MKSTRQFLEEQAAERESERDEYSKELTCLQALLKEKDKEQSSRERYTTEVGNSIIIILTRFLLSYKRLGSVNPIFNQLD